MDKPKVPIAPSSTPIPEPVLELIARAFARFFLVVDDTDDLRVYVDNDRQET